MKYLAILFFTFISFNAYSQYYVWSSNVIVDQFGQVLEERFSQYSKRIDIDPKLDDHFVAVSYDYKDFYRIQFVKEGFAVGDRKVVVFENPDKVSYSISVDDVLLFSERAHYNTETKTRRKYYLDISKERLTPATWYDVVIKDENRTYTFKLYPIKN